MKRIGITGQSGFIGTHLLRLLQLERGSLESIPFEDSFFQNDARLRHFVASCDVIVHLAGMNRNPDPQVIYDTNIALTDRLIGALEAGGATPYLLFASSIQEKNDNLYGKSKRECRLKLEGWAARNQALFTGLIIPNVFGPGALPYYNSFIATFSDQLIRGESPHVFEDRPVDLVYVESLGRSVIDLIKRPRPASALNITPDFTRSVAQVLEILQGFYQTYVQQRETPVLQDVNMIHLFETFRSYFPDVSGQKV